MGKLNFGEGKASLALSPPPAEHTAHRWCKNVSEKQELSGGKFPVPGWTEKDTKIKKKKKIGQQVVLAHTVLGDSICQEQQEICIERLNWEFSSKDALNSHSVLLQCRWELREHCLNSAFPSFKENSAVIFYFQTI